MGRIFRVFPSASNIKTFKGGIRIKPSSLAASEVARTLISSDVRAKTKRGALVKFRKDFGIKGSFIKELSN